MPLRWGFSGPVGCLLQRLQDATTLISLYESHKKLSDRIFSAYRQRCGVFSASYRYHEPMLLRLETSKI